MSRSVVLAAFAALVASSSAFAPPSGPVYGSLSRSHAVAMRPAGAAPVARTARAPMALRMQSEDDKAKAAGVAAALIGLIVSGFSPLIAVLFGGAAVYAGKLPEEGDRDISDTAKQVSLLLGKYALKAFDFAKEKDAEQGLSAKFTDQIKDAVESAKGNIKQG